MIPFGVFQSQGGAAPVACAITFLDNMGGFGYTSFDINGQVLSIVAAGGVNYANATDLAGVATNWSGIRIVEASITGFTPGDTTQSPVPVQLLRPSDFDNVFCRWDVASSYWVVGHSNGAGVNYGSVNVPGVVTDNMAIGIDGATGDAIIYQNGIVVADKNTTPDDEVLTGMGGLFNSQNVAILSQILGPEALTSYEVTVRTAATDILSPPSGTNDWCGNTL